MKLKRFLGLIAASSLGAGSLLTANPAAAQTACPSASGQTFAAWATATTGNCAGTPDEYGVTVYKMGLCTSNPAGSPGSAADYSSCSLSFEDASGSYTSFAAGGSSALPATFSSRPADGTYNYAIILISKTFKIKAEYGPIVAPAGGPGAGTSVTYYSTPTSVGNTGKPNITGPASAEPVDTTSFNPGTACDAQDTVSGSSGPMTGYLLDSGESLIVDDTSVTSCAGAEYILGVVALNSPVTIDDTVTALDATFTVTNNGTTIVSDQGQTGIIFESGPFDVVLSVVR